MTNLGVPGSPSFLNGSTNSAYASESFKKVALTSSVHEAGGSKQNPEGSVQKHKEFIHEAFCDEGFS